MKTQKLILALVIILSMGIGTASADQGGISYAFIPLNYQGGDPAAPLEVQSMHSFDRLASKFHAAQQQGDIIAFEPELSFGFIKVQYRSGFDITSLVGIPVYDDIHTALALNTFREKKQSQIQKDGVPRLQVDLYGSCFEGFDLGANRHIVASLRDKTGRVVANYEGNADGDGWLWDCFNWSGPYTSAVPGYKITFQRYNGSTILGTYSSNVPMIKFTSVNKATATVTGIAPAGKPYDAYWGHPKLDLGDNYLWIEKEGTVPVTSHWSVDFGTLSMRGHDYTDFWVWPNSHFGFGRYFYVPAAYCELGSNYCHFHGFPGQAATFTITHAGVPRTFTGKFDIWGYFYAELLDANLDPIFLAAGDKVSGTGITKYVLPKLTATPQYLSDKVTGQAPANRNFYVELYLADSDLWYYRWVHSDATGKYTADFSSSLDIKPEDTLTLNVYYRDPGTGNDTDYYNLTGP
jgi:hypothetical protein